MDAERTSDDSWVRRIQTLFGDGHNTLDTKEAITVRTKLRSENKECFISKNYIKAVQIRCPLNVDFAWRTFTVKQPRTTPKLFKTKHSEKALVTQRTSLCLQIPLETQRFWVGTIATSQQVSPADLILNSCTAKFSGVQLTQDIFPMYKSFK